MPSLDHATTLPLELPFVKQIFNKESGRESLPGPAFSAWMSCSYWPACVERFQLLSGLQNTSVFTQSLVRIYPLYFNWVTTCNAYLVFITVMARKPVLGSIRSMACIGISGYRYNMARTSRLVFIRSMARIIMLVSTYNTTRICPLVFKYDMAHIVLLVRKQCLDFMLSSARRQ